jgi:hypothetical protein
MFLDTLESPANPSRRGAEGGTISSPSGSPAAPSDIQGGIRGMGSGTMEPRVSSQPLLGSDLDYGLLTFAFSAYIFSLVFFRFIGNTINWMLTDSKDAPDGQSGSIVLSITSTITLSMCCLRALFRAQTTGMGGSWTSQVPDDPSKLVGVFFNAICFDPRTFALGFFSLALVSFALATSKMIAIRVVRHPNKRATLVNWHSTSSYLPGLSATRHKEVIVDVPGNSTEQSNKERTGWYKNLWLWTDPVGSKLWSNLLTALAVFFVPGFIAVIAAIAAIRRYLHW